MIGNICPALVSAAIGPHEPAELDGVSSELFKDIYILQCCKNCGCFYLEEIEKLSIKDVIGTL